MDNDKDKKLIKSPYYSPENLERYSELLQRGLQDLNISKTDSNIEIMSQAVRDYIEKTNRLDEEKIETMNHIWDNFKDSPNNEVTLIGKARTVAVFVLLNINKMYEWFIELRNNNKILDKVTDELFIQITSIYMVMVGRMIEKFLERESSIIFIVAFQTEIIDSIRRIHSGNDIQKNIFISDINKHLEEYSKLPFENETTQSKKGTLLWEFSKNIGKIIGKEKDPIFNALIERMVLRDVINLQLDKLLIIL
ncbi:MAG TPA: hypothetical protein VMR49_00115 [Candidatus Paceibacterota bacterium]|nr:hypothetical protein [Candidatus Paceibacterota bacterium]